MSAHVNESWRAIPGYEGRYDASDLGRLRSWLKHRGTTVPRVLKPGTNGRGYEHLYLYAADGSIKCWKVHQLVLLAFVGALPAGQEVRHLNNQRDDNRLVNLLYGSRSENVMDRVRSGTHHYAKRTHCKSGHPFDEQNTRRDPDGRRACRACHRDSYWRRKAAAAARVAA